MTKPKPSHFRGASKATEAATATWPTSFSGDALAREVQASGLSAETKGKLVRGVMDHVATHAECTQTFIKKVRKLLRS